MAGDNQVSVSLLLGGGHRQTIAVPLDAPLLRQLVGAIQAKGRGEVPRDRAALEALPGVGRKTANVVLNVAFGEPTIAVDTHIFRVANRTGLAPGKTPLAVEAGLEAITPAEYKRYAHHWLILHGRYVCQARKPDCPHCVVADLCRYGAKTGPAELIAARASSGEPAALAETETDAPPVKPVRRRALRPSKSRVGSRR